MSHETKGVGETFVGFCIKLFTGYYVILAVIYLVKILFVIPWRILVDSYRSATPKEATVMVTTIHPVDASTVEYRKKAWRG